MNKLLALADRVEKLTGPDREVDAEIAHAIAWRWDGWVEGDVEIETRPLDYVVDRVLNSHNSIWRYMPAFTASIGPAITLLPDDWDHMEIYRPDHQTLGWTVHVMYNTNIDRAQITGFAQSHELALVAASLRARAHGGGEG